jgi:hypothetical protein
MRYPQRFLKKIFQVLFKEKNNITRLYSLPNAIGPLRIFLFILVNSLMAVALAETCY